MTPLIGGDADGHRPRRVHDEEAVEHAAGIISALDSSLRIRIVLALRRRDHVVHELVSSLGKSQPLISQHLRVLKRAGIVDSERSGREVIYHLTSEAAANIIDTAADAAHELSVSAPTRDDLAAERRRRAKGRGEGAGAGPDQGRGEVAAKAAIIGPDDRAPEPGLAPSTPTPPVPPSR